MPNEKSNEISASSTSSDNLTSIPLDLENEEDLDLLNIDLLHKMDTEDIENLKKCFFDEIKIRNSSAKNLNENQIHGLKCSKAEFIEIMEKVAGSSMVLLTASKLFDSLDLNKEGFIRWENVIDAIISKTEKLLERKIENWQPVNPAVDIHYASHCKRESIVKVVSLRTQLTFCYAIVSKLGRVGVYDSDLNLLDTYNLCLKPKEGKNEFMTEERGRRPQTTWITDAVFVPDCYAIFFSASNCTLHLYDATGLIHVPLCLITGIKTSLTCMDYYSCSDGATPASYLVFGDDQGDVTVMQFYQPRKSLFRKKDPDKLDTYRWAELNDQSEYVTYQTRKSVHNDAILQISYCPGSKSILTCSNDPLATMVLQHIERKRRPYVFRVPRGIKCFHLEKTLHIIVTGSKDGLVRVWNEVVTKQPVISLHGHRTSVVDVRILSHMSAIFSLSEEGLMKVWNLNHYYCQMSLQLNFPIFKVPSARIEFGTRSIYPGPSSSTFNESAFTNSKDESKVNSLADTIETWLSAKDFDKRKDEEWNSIVVICCDFIASLKLNPLPPETEVDPSLDALKKFAMLPPPSRELYASVPTPWKIADSFTRLTPDQNEDINIAKSPGSSSTKNMLQPKMQKKIQNINADPVKAPATDMNAKRAQYRIKQDQMKMLVKHCAPHLALDLYDLAPIKFSKPMPVTRRMMEKGIDVSDPEHLLKGKLRKDSTVTTGESLSEILSPHSPKCSKPAPKKNSSLNKGRQTPEWLAEKIRASCPDLTESDQNSL